MTMINTGWQPSFSSAFPIIASTHPPSMPWMTTPKTISTATRAVPVSYPMNLLQSGSSLMHPPPVNMTPFSNASYNRLKKSSSRSSRRSIDTHSLRSPPSELHPISVDDLVPVKKRRHWRTKSISEIQHSADHTVASLRKTQSWHSIGNKRPDNFSVAYAHEMHLIPKSRQKRSLSRQRSIPKSPRSPSFRGPRKFPVVPIEQGVVRISTLDELPIRMNPRYKRRSSMTNDRFSIKSGVTTHSVKNRQMSTQTPKPKKSTKTRSINVNLDEDGDEIRMGSDIRSVSPSSSSSSSTSSDTSISSLQTRMNRTLKKDPLITTAIKEFQKLQQNSHRTGKIRQNSKHHISSRISPKPESVLDSESSSSSSTISHVHSQSSLTSVERSEIREIIKNFKNKTKPANEQHTQVSSIPAAPPTEVSSTIYSHLSIPTTKPRKSSVTEELDREFNKLRALDPNHELTNVIPSTICKRKKTLEKPLPSLPPLPTFKEMLNQVQLRPVDKMSISNIQTKAWCAKDRVDDPLPFVAVPQSSPIPTYESMPIEMPHEYAQPMKKPIDKPIWNVSHFQPMRYFGRSMSPKQPLQPPSKATIDHTLSATTFQPARTLPSPKSYQTMTSITENMYTSDPAGPPIHSTHQQQQQQDENQILQTHLESHSILTDYYFDDYDPKSLTDASTFTKLSRLFRRKSTLSRKADMKESRCSLM